MSSFIIRVKTGNKWGAATNAKIKTRLYDSEDMKTRWIDLDVGQFNALETVNVSGMPIGKTIDRVELRRENLFWFRTPDWYAEHVEVESTETKEVFFFPIHRWILADHCYAFKQFDTILPQDDTHKDQRQMELKEKKKQYQYYQQEKGYPVEVWELPNDEKWTMDWESHERTRGFKLSIEKTFTKINTLLFSWSSIKDIEQVFESVGWGVFHKPKEVIDKWDEDKWFGAQRLCGVHPFLIERCKEIPEKLGVSADDVNEYLGEDMTLDKAIEKKKIYMVDLKVNEEIGQQNDLKPYGPIALFFCNEDKDLVPIAIQLRQQKGPDNPVFYPGDDEKLWTMAKLWFNMADGFYHQAITHLGYCHSVMEGIVVCTHRNLSPSHPIYKLLMPYFYNTLAINNLIPHLLGQADESHRIKGKGVHTLLKAGFKDFKLDVHSDLINDLKNRGVDDEDDLPNYHYREDAMLLWFAILKYTDKIVKHFYADDDTVKGDTELQVWGEELTRPYPEGIELKGVAGDGNFNKRDDLTTVCIQIIYTTSVKHAAVNNPQYEQYSWAPNYPTWLRGELPSKKDSKTKADLLATLPTKDAMLSSMSLASFVSESTEDNNLGHFLTTYFHSSECKEIHKEFVEELKEISGKIKDRNDERKYKYEWLDPDHVGNSIYI